MTEEAKHYCGHRERLRDKFTTHPEALADYELLELLLFYVLARRDTKPLAKALIERFGSLRGVVLADLGDLESMEGVGKASSHLMTLIHEIFNRSLLGEIHEFTSIMSTSQVLDYYKSIMEQLKKEQFRVMFLSNTNKLIRESLMQEGTINSTSIYPREIIQKALNYGASAIIMVHNHPGGNPRPSRQDMIMTRTVLDVAQKLDIALLDHLIIGKNTHVSLKDGGII
ncbi:MAG: DNA repair protein RadC [Holosporaceae bacterium]|jgi:DNA repair protein RadC|nr:DNA repair protein RadC [Holosporaceae bacterium]